MDAPRGPRAHATFALATALVGVAGALFATAFRLALHHGFDAILGHENVLRAFRSMPYGLRVAIPALGGLGAGVVGVFAARAAAGQGVGAILEAVALGRGRISLRTTLWKALASFLALVTGGSLGREGSIVQFGAGVGSFAGARLGVDPRRTRALVAAGTAAGFAAAYNTPLAAVLFVLEVVTGLVTFDVVLPVVVATAVSTAVTRALVGGGPIYGERAFAVNSPAELVAFALLGALAGALGTGFLGALARGERAFRATRLPTPARTALGGAGVGLLACALPEVTGNGYEAIQSMLDTRLPVATLAVLLVAKGVATVSSVSSGSPGGIFTPALFLGAALGGIVGAAVPGASVGGYALVGMAALTAATTHAPLMAAVLVFELSGDYAIVLPLLLATVVATLVARRLRRDSVYTEELRRRGVMWDGTHTERIARAVRARDLLEPAPPCVAASDALDDALRAFERGRGRRVYVVDAARVRAIDLHVARRVWAARAQGEAVEGRTAGDVAEEVPVAFPDDSLLELNEKLWATDWGEIPVVDPKAPGTVLGIITRRAMLGAFDRELLQRDALTRDAAPPSNG